MARHSAPRVAVGIGVVLRELFQFADIDLAHQCRDVLVVFISRLGFRDRNLVEDRWVEFHHAELADIAAEFGQALGGPWRHDGIEIAPGNAEVFFEDRAIFGGVEQTQRRLENRRTLDRVEGHLLDQLFQLFGQGRFTATDRAQQIEDLFLLFQALSGMAEIRHDLVDAFFHPVEVLKGRIAADHLVGKRFATASSWSRCRAAPVRRWPARDARRRRRRRYAPSCTVPGTPAGENSSWRVDSKRCWKWLKILMTSPRSIRGADAGSVSRCWQATEYAVAVYPPEHLQGINPESYSR